MNRMGHTPNRTLQQSCKQRLFCESHNFRDWDFPEKHVNYDKILIATKWRISPIKPKCLQFLPFDWCFMIFTWFLNDSHDIHGLYLIYIFIVCLYYSEIKIRQTSRQICRKNRQICRKVFRNLDSTELVKLAFYNLVIMLYLCFEPCCIFNFVN